MSLVKEIIQRVRAPLELRFPLESGITFSDRYLYSKMLTARAKLLNRVANKKQKINLSNYQNISCIEVLEVPESECPCLPPAGCKVVRTKEKIPDAISSLSAELIDWVISPDNTIKFSRTSKDKLRFTAKGSRFTAGANFYLLDNGYMYLYGKFIPETIEIRMLAQDPWKAYKFSSCGKEEDPCESPLDFEFPIDSNLMDTLVEMTILETLGLVEGLNEEANQER